MGHFPRLFSSEPRFQQIFEAFQQFRGFYVSCADFQQFLYISHLLRYGSKGISSPQKVCVAVPGAGAWVPPSRVVGAGPVGARAARNVYPTDLKPKLWKFYAPNEISISHNLILSEHYDAQRIVLEAEKQSRNRTNFVLCRKRSTRVSMTTDASPAHRVCPARYGLSNFPVMKGW